MMIVSDRSVSRAASGAAIPNAAAIVQVTCDPRILFQLDGGAWGFALDRARRAITATDGGFTIVLPWPSESDPAGLTWSIVTPNGETFAGAVPEGVAGPLTLYQLVTSYGWQYTGDATP